jgi:hypothetical protein
MCLPFTAEMRFSASCNIVQGVDMAIKEEERGEYLETKVADTQVNSTDVNVRTGMTNDQFEMYQRKDVDQQVEFKDDLYDAVKRGDIQRVKELTGWSRDATRPEDTIVNDMTKETQDNADKIAKEEEAKRQQEALNAQNAAATGAEGQGPVDALMAFMLDPFGLTKSGPSAPEPYTGNSLEEAVRRGDWSAAARIMNALRAREQSEGQDFTGDGVVSGGNNAMEGGYVNPTSYGWSPEFQDANGNFQPWAVSANGDVKTIDGTQYDAATNTVTFQNAKLMGGSLERRRRPQSWRKQPRLKVFLRQSARVLARTGNRSLRRPRWMRRLFPPQPRTA